MQEFSFYQRWLTIFGEFGNHIRVRYTSRTTSNDRGDTYCSFSIFWYEILNNVNRSFRVKHKNHQKSDTFKIWEKLIQDLRNFRGTFPENKYDCGKVQIKQMGRKQKIIKIGPIAQKLWDFKVGWIQFLKNVDWYFEK